MSNFRKSTAKVVLDAKHGYYNRQPAGIPEHIKQRQLAAKVAKCAS